MKTPSESSATSTLNLRSLPSAWIAATPAGVDAWYSELPSSTPVSVKTRTSNLFGLPGGLGLPGGFPGGFGLPGGAGGFLSSARRAARLHLRPPRDFTQSVA